ncbi:MAG: 3'(2'),5'-bisphosphate nucleotidase [Planctomycetaceae bacterium]
MSADFSHELTIALAAVRAASLVCRHVQAGIEAIEKDDRSPVTVADFASQAIIGKALAEAFPDDPLIAEEDARALRTPDHAPHLARIVRELETIGLRSDGAQVCDWIDRGNADAFAERFWTLDPIDGTKGFLRGEQYAVALALIVAGRVEVAVLGCPNLAVEPVGRITDPFGSAAGRIGNPSHQASSGAIFAAVRGRGANVRPLDVGDLAEAGTGRSVLSTEYSVLGTRYSAPIHVSRVDDPRRLRMCESVEAAHSAHGRSARVAALLGVEAEPVRLDSQAKYAVVARGEGDVYLRLPTRRGYREKIWDHASGALLVEEAGGRVTDLFGLPLDWTHGATLAANRGILATNGPLHDRVLAALRRTYEEDGWIGDRPPGEEALPER